ncbi:ETS domain-containing protein [Aphelenchoides fujianensis]|nr:ETS domain-containing protein [Aphelenchoides fujianensis]
MESWSTMECDASIMKYIDECLENPPAYFSDGWDLGASPRTPCKDYEDAFVPEMQQPNKSLAYGQPFEDDVTLYSFDKQPVQQQQAEKVVEVNGELDHIVPTLGMHYDASFDPVEHFEPVPLAPFSSKEASAYENDWDSEFSARAPFEDASGLETSLWHEPLPYDEPAEEGPVFYDFDENPVQHQEAHQRVEHVQEVAEQRVPVFGTPFVSSFHPVDDFEPVPADPLPSKAASENEDEREESSNKEKKSRKRGISKPKPKARRRADRLYEFTYRLLSNWNRYKDVIEWIDWENGLWRVVDSDEYARLWGIHKRNPKMTYKTLGRGLRYAYAWGILEEHGPQNLVQQFTPAYRCLTPFSPPSSPRR